VYIRQKDSFGFYSSGFVACATTLQLLRTVCLSVYSHTIHYFLLRPALVAYFLVASFNCPRTYLSLTELRTLTVNSRASSVHSQDRTVAWRGRPCKMGIASLSQPDHLHPPAWIRFLLVFSRYNFICEDDCDTRRVARMVKKREPEIPCTKAESLVRFLASLSTGKAPLMPLPSRPPGDKGDTRLCLFFTRVSASCDTETDPTHKAGRVPSSPPRCFVGCRNGLFRKPTYPRPRLTMLPEQHGLQF
jgi:hypothetical protein